MLTVVAADDEGNTLDASNWTSTPSPDTTLSQTQTEVTVSWTFSDTGDVFTSTVTIEARAVKIYGVTWDGSSTTALTRTDDAASFSEPVPAVGTGSGSSPFDDCYPWKDITKETKDGNVLVKIPKFWFKRVKDGNQETIQIADAELPGFSVSPMHSDRGDGAGERDYAYVSRYTLNTSYKSTSGNSSAVNITRAIARTNIHDLGANYWQYDYLTLMTIWMLYIVEFADWDSQTKVGRGYVDSNSAQINTGGTDSMTYHTGRAAGTDGKTAVQYRWMENLWGNIYQWCDGIVFSSADIYVQTNPASFSDATSGATKVGYTRATSGNYASGSRAGLFCCYGSYEASGSYSGIGARLIYLP